MAIEQTSIPTPSGQEVLKNQGQLFDLVAQPMLIGSSEVEFEKVRRPPGVRMIIRSNNGNILLTREFRSETGGWDYRLPGGKVFDLISDYNAALSDGLDITGLAIQSAIKEALEETGIELTNLTHLHTSVCGATVEWDLHYFEAVVPTEAVGSQQLETGENIQVGWYSPAQVLEHLLIGDISEDRSAAVLFRYLHMLGFATDSVPENQNLGVGARLLQLLKLTKLNSVKPIPENLSRLREIDAVFIVGSSFTGKSTLVDILRQAIADNPQEFTSIFIPKRVITRPQRQNDNLVENSFVDIEQFTDMISRGEIDMHWVRNMERNRTERYGFLQAPVGTLPIYSANNAIVNNSGSFSPQELLVKSLIIDIYAPENIRRERLIHRSPDLIHQKPEEVAYRLSDKAVNMYSGAHIIVRNFGRFQEDSKSDIVNLVRLIIESRS